MDTTLERRSISLTDTAKLIRQDLKKQFGSFPFSVRSKSYSGGCSITVYWTDGPTTQQVDPIIKKYEGADFDGMTDLKTYRDSPYQVDYCFTQRTISQ